EDTSTRQGAHRRRETQVANHQSAASGTCPCRVWCTSWILEKKKICQFQSGMNRKRNIRLTISLLVLIVLTIVIYTVSHRKNYAVTDPDIFQLDDYKAIDRVSLTSNAETIDIAFDGTRWRINEAHAADRQMIDLLFATLQQVKPRRPA